MAILPGTNSYVTLSEADEYLAGEVGGERWAALTDEQKERYLITAARHMAGLRLSGARLEEGQKMPFPRFPISDMEPVKAAQIREAFALSDAQAANQHQLQEQGVQSISIGSASMSFKDSAGAGDMMSKEALRLLRPYLLGSVRIV